jgi:hypothetical protein
VVEKKQQKQQETEQSWHQSEESEHEATGCTRSRHAAAAATRNAAGVPQCKAAPCICLVTFGEVSTNSTSQLHVMNAAAAHVLPDNRR